MDKSHKKTRFTWWATKHHMRLFQCQPLLMIHTRSILVLRMWQGWRCSRQLQLLIFSKINLFKTLTVKHKDLVDRKWVDMANRGTVCNNLHLGKWATTNQDTDSNLKWVVAMVNHKEVVPEWWTLKEWTLTLRHHKEWIKELTHTLRHHKEWAKELTHTLKHHKEWNLKQ